MNFPLQLANARNLSTVIMFFPWSWMMKVIKNDLVLP